MRLVASKVGRSGVWGLGLLFCFKLFLLNCGLRVQGLRGLVGGSLTKGHSPYKMPYSGFEGVPSRLVQVFFKV